MKKKTFALLGSTGSIGKTSLSVINKLKNTKVELIFADKNFREIIKQIKIFRPRVVIVNSLKTFTKLKNIFKNNKIIILNDYKKSKKYLKKIDVTISAIPGIKGLEPTIFFIEISKKILIANKESVICGWNLIKAKAKKFNTKFIPIDSEHFSINYLLNHFPKKEIKKIYITASGGPFLNFKKNYFNKIKPHQAIKHPKWKMGKKISIDSATLMNKVLEVIEALKLFNLSSENIEILVHPQSLVHSILELKNGLKVFLYHKNDMKIPILNAIETKKYYLKIFDFDKNIIEKNLTFLNVDKKKFPVVDLLKKINIKNSSPILINAANEVLVDKFLNKNISFNDISKYLKLFLDDKKYIKTSKIKPNSINKVKKVDFLGREIAFRIVDKHA